ncbi:uncharacterized protein LOC142160588 [Mixophyes fleayi]|uniref:uncharacterized protein LOC142160588 n=1 Tax=Mixophyes fleayi TaxID=3061075 RepID=UPI003F4E2C34
MATKQTSLNIKHQRIKQNSKLLNEKEKGKPSVYQLNLDLCKSGYHKYNFGKENHQIPNKVILLLGATGSGKTTLINGMANYILGVEWKDDFRYKLVHEVTNKSQAHSQTSVVTAYKINYESGNQIPYSLTLIDTPGFGDTRGIEQDKKITEDIDAFFTAHSGIDQIDAVCFVVQASLPRLTSTQKYIFNSVFSIFGKDIKDNIFILINFSDAETPPVLEAIKHADIPCPLDSNGDPIHFKFNNSALFANNQASNMSFNEMFWNMGVESMRTFFSDLSKLESKSLKLTKEVLMERKQLQMTLQALQTQIKAGLIKLDEIRKTQEALQQNKGLMAANKYFEYEVYITVAEMHKVNNNTTNCSKCKFTCDDVCRIPFDSMKWLCDAMKNGHCTQCPGKCAWRDHTNERYKWDYVTKIVKRTSDQLKNRYEKAAGEVMNAGKIFIKLKEEYDLVKDAVFLLICKSSQSLKRLHEIALIPNQLSVTDYIDLRLQSEEQEAKPGYRERIKSLMEVREQEEMLQEIQKAPNNNFKKAEKMMCTFFSWTTSNVH